MMYKKHPLYIKKKKNNPKETDDGQNNIYAYSCENYFWKKLWNQKANNEQKKPTMLWL